MAERRRTAAATNEHMAPERCLALTTFVDRSLGDLTPDELRLIEDQMEDQGTIEGNTTFYMDRACRLCGQVSVIQALERDGVIINEAWEPPSAITRCTILKGRSQQPQ